MARTVLVVDDNLINRSMLAAGLQDEYEIMEAADGREAMGIIRRSYKLLSAVLLDLQMPVMDGFEVLREVKGNPVLAQLPVIVVTGSGDEGARLRALECGANDFVQKPYNPDIIRHCLRNNIALRESASIINAIQKDKLTGILNREYFFEKAGELIRGHEPGAYVLACIDIDNFKLINDQYGAPEGDRILRHIGAGLKTALDGVQGVCGRIAGDNFAVLHPNRPEVLGRLEAALAEELASAEVRSALRYSVGRYVVTERSLPVSAQYDRAFIAKQSVKGRYDAHTAYFDESMLQALVLEQEIVVEMAPALKNREFEVWLQPQYNHATGALIGSEALVRWRHPGKGLIYPKDFIPVFERNGFVYELDKFVWEESCRFLRKWLDEGRDPLPVSVNISRYDLLREDLIAVLSGLLERYRIPAELLRLEITESAFSESSEQLIAAVKRFISLRFTVEIDDFGSGYSSLNTLKDVPAQVLKLDMCFLEGKEGARRSGSILESITRMARWIGMAVIAEGVETVEQADYLKSIGCNYVQGYLYGRPLPLAEYEALAAGAAKERQLKSFEAVVTLDNDSFWDPDSLDTLVFNSFVGGACIFELCSGRMELLRVNDSFVRELGGAFEPGAALELLDPARYLDDVGRERLVEVIGSAAVGQEQSCELRLSDDGTYFKQPQFVRCDLRVIARAGDRLLYYCVITNCTTRRQAERSKQSAIEQLQFLNDMAHDLLAQPDVEEGLNTALEKLREYFEGRRAYIFEFDYKANTVSNSYEDCAEGVSREKDRLQQLPLERAAFWIEFFSQKDCYVVEDAELLGDERGEERDALLAHGVRSIFAVPLYRGGKLMGLIGIDDPGRLFPQMDHMAALGDYIAVMLTRRDLSAQIVAEDRELLHQLRKTGTGLRELSEERSHRRRLDPTAFLRITLGLAAAMLALLVFFSPGRPGSHMDSFSETVLTLSEGWTLTDSSGAAREIELPLTIDYGADGLYTLRGTLPLTEELIRSPALCFYSNYVDLRVRVDGETLLVYPREEGFAGATGNSYHYVRLPTDFEGKSVEISLRCQLGDDITYLLKAPLLGAKATMLRTGIRESLPSIVLAGCMLILALVLAALHISLKRQLELNSATAYTAIFAILFAFYVFSETTYAQMLGANPYRIFSATLMLLALLPLPLVGLFSEELSDRYKAVPLRVMGLCAVNFVLQAALHYTGISSLRVTLTATHVTIVIAITVMAVFLFLSGRTDKPSARKKLLSALPMIVGGMADIILLSLNKPSFNNSLWFTLGVTCFIVIQFCDFVHGFFVMYRTSLEVTVLKDLAYRDALTNIGNRNAYERKLKELSQNAVSPELCCLVVDINDLKQINDGYGHSVGDAAIVETGRILEELAPGHARCYRAGGDEFIVLVDRFDELRAAALAEKLEQEAARRGKRYNIPLSLAIGSGCYTPADGSLLDFIRRVDTRMYEEKRRYKSSPDYPFKGRR